ncbi:hypothetical protein Hanom_Chr04g00362851 [Helianthus anomalus]
MWHLMVELFANVACYGGGRAWFYEGIILNIHNLFCTRDPKLLGRTFRSSIS